MLDGFDRLFKATIYYLEGNLLKWSAKKYQLSLYIIKRTARDIIAGESMEKILKTSTGYNGKLGLDFAMAKLKIYHFKTKKIPSTTNKGMGDVINAVFKGYWQKYGINSWNDLLVYVFGKKKLKECEELRRRQKFDIAILKLEKFFQKYQRLPKFEDKEVRDIINIIRTGLWKQYGINSWNDMLSEVFNDFNFESRKYVSSDGYEKAVKELRDYYKKEGSLPIYDDFVGITCAIRKGYWKELGIYTWNDLLTKIFGEINFINNKYKDNEGFKLAVKVLKEFEKINGRRPNNKDKGISGIKSAINRGEWRSKGINTWKDMILHVFRNVKSRWEKYTGEEGLEFAVNKLRLYKDKNQRVPTVREKGLSGIKGAVYRGEWKLYGITNWNDLVLYAFGELKISKNKYEGKKGLENVVKFLKEFKKSNGKLPRTTDKEMNGIKKALYRGDWNDFGIKSWKGLINYVLKSLTIKQNDSADCN